MPMFAMAICTVDVLPTAVDGKVTVCMLKAAQRITLFPESAM